jgi:hypothetical protein
MGDWAKRRMGDARVPNSSAQADEILLRRPPDQVRNME